VSNTDARRPQYHTVFASALPSDVRKVFDLPKCSLLFLGWAQVFGAQPQVLESEPSGGAEPPPHIKRQSREKTAQHLRLSVYTPQIDKLKFVGHWSDIE